MDKMGEININEIFVHSEMIKQWKTHPINHCVITFFFSKGSLLLRECSKLIYMLPHIDQHLHNSGGIILNTGSCVQKYMPTKSKAITYAC